MSSPATAPAPLWSAAPSRGPEPAAADPPVRGRHFVRRTTATDLGAACATGASPLAALLDERVRFDALIAKLSTHFINLPTGDVGRGIGDALRQIVEFLAVDRADFGEVSESDRAFRLTHSYTAPGLLPSVHASLDRQLAWYTAIIHQWDVVSLPDGPPAEFGHGPECHTRSGLGSQLIIPLTVGGSVKFAIGCASVRKNRRWPEDLDQRLRLFGEVLANALTRARADVALGERECRYRELVESTRAVPWEAEPDTLETIYISPQVVPLLGYPSEAWYREGFWASCLHPNDRAAVLRRIGDAVGRGHDHEAEYRLMAADGSTVWVRDLVMVRAEAGAAKAVRGVMIDVTDRKAAEDEAARLRDQLARAARVTTLGEMAAAIAHEVNQPLCAIVSNAETAQDYLAGGDVAEVREALRDIVADGRRASETVRRIRAMVRKRQPERAAFTLNEAVREVATLLRHQLTRDGVTLTFDVATDVPPVLGDRVQVQQVVLNLMVNAAEAVAGGPADRRRLSVAATRDGDMVTVSVRDAGPGIRPDARDRIFETFFTTKPDGTGIGLSISRTIVEAHGGRIWAESAAGGGTAFHFTLPLVAGPSP